MSDTVTIQASKRERSGKGYARTLRRAEKIPAVVYGHGYEPVSITLDGNVLNKMFKPGNEDAAEYQLFLLQIESGGALIEKQVMVKKIQRHNYELLDCLIDYLKSNKRYKITSNIETEHRSSILTFSCDKPAELHKTLSERKIICSFRQGSIRVLQDHAGHTSNGLP